MIVVEHPGKFHPIKEFLRFFLCPVFCCDEDGKEGPFLAIHSHPQSTTAGALGSQRSRQVYSCFPTLLAPYPALPSYLNYFKKSFLMAGVIIVITYQALCVCVCQQGSLGAPTTLVFFLKNKLRSSCPPFLFDTNLATNSQSCRCCLNPRVQGYSIKIQS